MRRSATRGDRLIRYRGLKPTATVMRSLCDQPVGRANFRGHQVLERPEMLAREHARRAATVEPSDQNQGASALDMQVRREGKKTSIDRN